MKTHLFFCLVLMLGVIAVATSREVKGGLDGDLPERSYIFPPDASPYGYHDYHEPSDHVSWWQFPNGILWQNYTPQQRFGQRGYDAHPPVRAGRWSGPGYRPARFPAVPRRMAPARVLTRVPAARRRSTVRRDRGLLANLFYKLFRIKPGSRWFHASAASPSVRHGKRPEKAPEPASEGEPRRYADPPTPEAVLEQLDDAEDATVGDPADGPDDNRSEPPVDNRSRHQAPASRDDPAQEDISAVSPEFVIPEIEKRGTRGTAEPNGTDEDKGAKEEGSEPEEAPDAPPVLPRNDIPQDVLNGNPDRKPSTQPAPPAAAKGPAGTKDV